jgi:predicted nucleic acid-binding Zn ribbon protein
VVPIVARNCAVCGAELPPTSRAHRKTCSATCRSRLRRLNRDVRPAWMLTASEAMERLALLDPERYGPLPPLEDDGGLPEDDSLDRLLARLDAADDGLELSTGSRRRERR